MNSVQVKELMSSMPLVYNVSMVTDDYHHYFETVLGYWLSGGGRPAKKFDYYKYASYMGGSLDNTATNPLSVVSKAQGSYYVEIFIILFSVE